VFDWKHLYWPYDSHIKRKHINHSYSFEIIGKPLEKRDESPIQSSNIELYHISIYIYGDIYGSSKKRSQSQKIFRAVSHKTSFEQSVTKKLFEQSVIKKSFEQSVIKIFQSIKKKKLSKWHSKSINLNASFWLSAIQAKSIVHIEDLSS